MPVRQANQYSTDLVLTTCRPSLGPGIDFGFVANAIRLVNDAFVPVHFTLTSTAAATTDDPELKPGEIVTMSVALTGMGLSTTSTTTSTGTDATRVRVQAWAS